MKRGHRDLHHTSSSIIANAATLPLGLGTSGRQVPWVCDPRGRCPGCVAGRPRAKFARLCSVGYVQTIPGVFAPGITLQRTSVCSVGHSYPCPELLEVLYDIHARTRNFCKFCTPVATIPGVRVQYVFVPARNFCEFCTPVL